MKNIICIVTFTLAASLTAHAGPRIELGAGAGKTYPYGSESFKDLASSGDAQSYWIGYGLTQNWGLELGLDYLDFDKINTKHQAMQLIGVYRFAAENYIHPIAKFGAGAIESKLETGEKTNSVGAKIAGGVEIDFKNISFGGLINANYIAKAADVDAMKNIYVVTPMIFLTIHTDVEYEKKSISEVPVSSNVIPEPVKLPKDTDGDGVLDEDDKCPNTPAGIVVNAFGCAETEKASVKLNIEFATAKATFDSTYNSEVQSLASFMTKFPQTKVEIAGHSDNQGLPERNMALSQKRADSVKTELVKAGIDSSRVTAKGYGQSQPVADNKTAEGRKQNRRVLAEISVITEKKK
jgi:OOP family OmpA-OmpF porin